MSCVVHILCGFGFDPPRIETACGEYERLSREDALANGHYVEWDALDVLTRATCADCIAAEKAYAERDAEKLSDELVKARLEIAELKRRLDDAYADLRLKDEALANMLPPQPKAPGNVIGSRWGRA